MYHAFTLLILQTILKYTYKQKIQVDKKLTPGIRVTVKNQSKPGSSKLKGLIVSPETPRTQNGIYWGYQVRYAGSFRKVLYGQNKFYYDTIIDLRHLENYHRSLKNCLAHKYIKKF